MPRFTSFFAAFRHTLARAAAAVLLAVSIVALSPAAVFASHGADDATTVATDAATQSATDQATEAASGQAAEAASEQATEQASERAAETANDQAMSGAQENATEGAMNGSGGMGSDDGSIATVSAEDAAGRAEKAADLAMIEVTRDINGDEIRAHEIVVLLDRKDESAVRKAGFNIVAQTALNSLGGELLRIRVPDAASTMDALNTVRTAAPEAIATANYVYRTADGPTAAGTPAMPAHASAAKSYEGLAGIIDTPLDRTYPGLDTAVADMQSFADGAPSDAVHGTAVADIIAHENVRLLAANVFAKDAAGVSAATTAAILRGLDWLVSRGVTVVNMSIEGPPDAAMGEAIRRAQAKGCIIVAAAGNKGPAAPPAYPAAFPSVVAVTAIDRQDHIYRYANQGAYISYAALGVDVDTALPPGGRQTSSGTSYSAPIVTALIARLDRDGTADNATRALAFLATQARHLGAPGRNPVFGLGALDGTLASYLGE